MGGFSAVSEATKLKLVEGTPLVKIEGLHKSFREVKALSDISLEIPRGKIVGLLGSNGSGKTTLIKILAGMYASYKGNATIEGRRPSHLTKAMVAYLPDKNSFSGEMTVESILDIYEDFFLDFNRDRCGDMLDNFEIQRGNKIQQMSKGVVDKLQIALVMSRKAKLYLLDEPIGGVDVGARDYVLDVILDSFNMEGTIVVATHLVGQVERLFDSAIILNKGKLISFEDCDITRQKAGLNMEAYLKGMFGVKYEI